MSIEELAKGFKGKRCSQVCPLWDSWDRDCHIYGEYHLTPSTCQQFLKQELARQEKRKEATE